jgi:WS/DGAT/MGAT family acyltransferase
VTNEEPVKESTLTAADHTWFRLQEAANPMASLAVLFFAEVLPIDGLKSLVEDRLMSFERFRQRIVPSRLPRGRPRWHEGDDFALDNHLFRATLSPQGTARDLETLISRLLAEAIAADQPLWQLHLIEEVDGGSVLIVKIHQSVADGTSASRIILGLGGAESGQHHPPEIVYEGLEAQLRTEEVVETASQPGSTVRSLCRLIAQRSDTDSSLMGKPTHQRQVTWSQGFPLIRLRSFATRLGASETELLLAAVTAALRQELVRIDLLPESTLLRAVVPCNLRSPDQDPLGSWFALAVVPLPVGRTTVRSRLRKLRQELDDLGSTRGSLAVFQAPGDPGFRMSEVEDQITRQLAKKTTLLLSFAPQPTEPLYFCGQKLEHWLYWPAQAGPQRLCLGLSATSDQIRLGVMVDEGSAADAHRLAQAFDQALAEIAAASGETT